MSEQAVDLSHYDLKDGFTIFEAARLMVGVDPCAQDDNELMRRPEWGRIRLFQQEMAKASRPKGRWSSMTSTSLPVESKSAGSVMPDGSTLKHDDPAMRRFFYA